MNALVIAEHADAAVELAAGARTLADGVDAACFSDVEAGCADRLARIEVPAGHIVDDAADTLIALFDQINPQLVLVEPTRRMKVIAGKLAAHCSTAVLTDATSVTDGVAESLYFGGLAVKKAKATGEVTICTVGAGVFSDCVPSGANAALETAWVEPATSVKLVASEPVESSGVDLAGADVIVAAGRGFADEEQLDLARALADKLGAGLGCTRPLTEGVDWFPREAYIGVSGQMLAPKAYVGVGVSGQMQHMVGVNRAKKVFAINKDANAPIFKQCDYGLVGDIADVLPQLVDEL